MKNNHVMHNMMNLKAVGRKYITTEHIYIEIYFTSYI